MRLVIATAVSALATTVAADAMMVYRNCEIPTVCHLYGAWYSGYGSFFVNAAEGCRGQGSGMVDFCMDCKQHHACLPLIHSPTAVAAYNSSHKGLMTDIPARVQLPRAFRVQRSGQALFCKEGGGASELLLHNQQVQAPVL